MQKKKKKFTYLLCLNCFGSCLAPSRSFVYSNYSIFLYPSGLGEICHPAFYFSFPGYKRNSHIGSMLFMVYFLFPCIKNSPELLRLHCFLVHGQRFSSKPAQGQLILAVPLDKVLANPAEIM